MVISPFDKYKETQAQTANSAKLLLMLYDGAIRFVKLGIEGMEQEDYEKTNNNLVKAQAIINELIASLNFDYQIANDLLKIYDYMLYQLIQANVKKNTHFAKEVYDYLVEMKEAWTEASKRVSI
ncbi:flagellar export chaperone FliS [Paenibacillus sp. M1]|uniref:Flagellar export chaperone FliS n=1 Tax=Paenibacillus haidiansis TaxID=1574488 RepID=A0ABU7VXG3_9BACL